MKKKIENISKMFSSTFLILNIIDPTLPQDKYLYIPKQDRRIIKMYYKLYNMKRYAKDYDVFEAMVIKHALNINEVPVVAAENLCLKSN